MGLKDKRKAAARATAARLCALKAQLENSTPNEAGVPEHNMAETITMEDADCEGGVTSEDSDGWYEGGVNCFLSDSDEDFNIGDYSDTESLEELEGDELEANLSELRAGIIAPTKYEQVMQPKLAEGWKKAEQNRSLGYTGHSQRTQERRANEARKKKIFNAEAQIS
jgi:hypothetical protein